MRKSGFYSLPKPMSYFFKGPGGPICPNTWIEWVMNEVHDALMRDENLDMLYGHVSEENKKLTEDILFLFYRLMESRLILVSKKVVGILSILLLSCRKNYRNYA